MECLADSYGAQGRNRSSPQTNIASALGVVCSVTNATRTTPTATPHQGPCKHSGLRVMGLAISLRPSSRAEPNQNLLQVVQTGIDHQLEHNGQCHNNHGPLGRRTLQNHNKVGQRCFEPASPQRLNSGEAASPNPSSTGSEPNHPNKRCSVWSAPLQECVFRTSTPSPARSRGPQFDKWRYHSLEQGGIFSSTNRFIQQHPCRKFRTFSRTNPRVSRPTRKSRRTCIATKTRRRTTECNTRIMDQ